MALGWALARWPHAALTSYHVGFLFQPLAAALSGLLLRRLDEARADGIIAVARALVRPVRRATSI